MKKTVSNIIFSILTIAVIYFLGDLVADNWSHVKGYTFNFDLPILIAASLAYVATLFISSIGWFLTLSYLHSPLSLSRAFIYSCITQPAKYIPGKIWVAVTRMKFCKAQHIPNSITLLSTGIEGVMEILAGTYISLIAMFNIPLFARFSFGGPLVIAIIGVTLMIPRIFYFIVNLYLRIVKQKLLPKDKHTTFLKLILLQAVYLLAMFGIGASQFLFLQSFAPVPSSAAPLFISVGAFSYVVSIIAFTPSGLGVREGIWYLALKRIATPSVALIYAFASRIWMIIIEAILLFICLPIALVLERRQRAKNPQTINDFSAPSS